MGAYERVQRISEPVQITKGVTILGGLLFAMELSYLAATGQVEVLILVAVWVVAVFIIIFVRDYWWSPALVITALSLTTLAAGFKLTGLEVGMVILGLTFPVKLAMKTLWPVQPKMDPGLFYWALISFLCVHAVVIFFYSKIEDVPQIKNIVKAYYAAIAPLVLYGMLVRYCKPKTVVNTGVVLFFTWMLTIITAVIVILLGVELPELTNLKIIVDYIDADGALGFLRGTGPYLFTAALAFWPAVHSNRQRLLLGFAVVLGVAGTLFSGGRTAMLACVVAGTFFAVARKRLWLAIPVIVIVAGTSATITYKPDLLYNLSEHVQRTLGPLNFSEQKTEVEAATTDSDKWHEELRTESLAYWTMDTTSFWVGHGFKSWDDTFILGVNSDLANAKKFAIEMGHTENMFSAITNIFGLTGLVLYMGFFIQLAARLWKGRSLAPEGSVERAICEFSFVILAAGIVMAPLNGDVPGIGLIYWSLGVLAARNYLGTPETDSTKAPAFDRSREGVDPRGAYGQGAQGGQGRSRPAV